MIININDYPFHYEAVGQGQPIFVFPGWSSSAADQAFAYEPAFTGREGWQRIYLDPPGHGASPGDPSIKNLDDMLAALLLAVDSLSEENRFLLFGTSLGAYLARGVLYHRFDNCDGLFQVVPVIVPQDDQRTVPKYQVLVEDPGIIEKLKPEERDLFSICTVRTQKFLDEMRSYPPPPENEAGDMLFLEHIREDPMAYCFSINIDNLEESFPGPTTIITGRQDSVVGFEDAWDILENFPRGTFIVTDRANHMMEEKSGFVHLLIREWLDRVEEYIKEY